MPQDAFTLKRIGENLKTEILGAKINKINQPNTDEVVLFLFNKGKNFKLLLSTNAISCRISFIKEEKPNPLTAYGFCMLLRKYLINAEITDVFAIENERIIKISLSNLNDFFERRNLELYVEIMGKYSNIVLTENDKILGSLKAFNLDLSSLRPLTVGMKYTLPPMQDKFLPSDKNLIEKLKTTDKNELNLGAFLFENVIGLAKSTANEIAVRYYNLYGEIDENKVYNHLNSFVNSKELKPCVKYDDNGMPKDFYVFDYRFEKGSTEYFSTVLEAQEECFNKKETARNYMDLKRKLISIIKKSDDKLKRRQEIIDKKRFECKNVDELKLKGELVLANIYKIKQGDESVEVLNYYDNTTMKITLDKTLSPSKNSEKFYKKYNKEKRTLSALVPQQEELNAEKEYINSLYSFVESSENVNDLASVESELKKTGFIKSEMKKQKKKIPEKYDTFSVDGVLIKVGKNNISNDELTSSSDRNFYWVHVKNYHSSHVIICDNNPSEKVIKTACEICAYHSALKGNEKVEVDYTLKKHVKKPQGAKLGFVNYTDYKTVIVSANGHDEYFVK